MPRIRRASAGSISPPGSPSQPQAAGGTTADTKNRSGGTPVPAVRWGKVDRRRSGRAPRRSPSPGAPRPQSQAHRRARQVSPDACGAGLFPEGGAIDRLCSAESEWRDAADEDSGGEQRRGEERDSPCRSTPGSTIGTRLDSAAIFRCVVCPGPFGL